MLDDHLKFVYLRSMPVRSPLFKSSVSWIVLCALLVTFCVAGGASRNDVMGQVVVRAAAVVALILVALFAERPSIGRTWPIFLILLATIALILLQLVPLPPEVWTKLPERAVFERADTLLDRPLSWRTWAIAPGLAINAVMSLLPPFATLVLMSGLSAREQRRLPALLLCLILVSTLIAVLQFSGANVSNPLVNQTSGDASGFFANRNHLSLWLAQGCLLVPAWAFLAEHRSGWRGPAGLGLMLLFLLTILATGSRAGILLGSLALVIAIVVAHKALKAELADAPRWVAPVAITGVCAIVATVVLVSVVADRAVSIDRALAIDARQDIRNRALPIVLTMIRGYFPLGSGAGSFNTVFRLHEPFELLKPTFFNHAHNDFLEIILDTGLPGLLLLVGALVWWSRASLRAWRAKPDTASMLPKLGSAMLLLVLVASLFDYPARTPLIMAMVVIAAVWLSRHRDNRDTPALPGQGLHL